MDVTFAKAKLQKVCNSDAKLRGEYGHRMAVVIQQRLLDLQEAETLEDFRTLPGRCHELTGDLKGCLALDLVHPKRLVFKPEHEPPPIDADGRLDWRKVTKVEVVAIGDYHN